MLDEGVSVIDRVRVVGDELGEQQPQVIVQDG